MTSICALHGDPNVAPLERHRVNWKKASGWTLSAGVLLVAVGAFMSTGGWSALSSAGTIGIFAIVIGNVGRTIRSNFTELRAAHERLRLALEESTRRARESMQLNELVDLLQSCQTAEEAYSVVAGAVPKILSSPSGALYLTGLSPATLAIAKTWGPSKIAAGSFGADECWALRRGDIHRVTDPASPVRCRHNMDLPAGGSLCVPLVTNGGTVGVLCVEYPASAADHPKEARAAQLDAIDRLAHVTGQRLSAALANLALREELRHQSVRDPLTGLFNRRYLEETLQRELRRAERNGDVVTLLMLDIDHFKRLNDSFGHQAGDAFLKKFGEFLCRRTRGQDVACRYGGEEFVLILSGASLETAKQRAELLREEAKKLAVQYEGHVLGSITLSVGVAASPVHGSTAEDLLRTADAALYRAKTKGRNLVVVGHLGASDVRPVRFRKPALRSVPARHQAVSAAPGGVQVPPRVPRFPRLSDTKTPDQDTQQSEYLDRVEEPGISVA